MRRRLTEVGTRPCPPVRVAGPAGWAGPNRRKMQLHTAVRPRLHLCRLMKASPRFDFGTRAARGTAARALSPSPSEITFRAFEPELSSIPFCHPSIPSRFTLSHRTHQNGFLRGHQGA
ncbi:hypothetical protein L1887_58454 [Cichorium endivia]|nr:hypothetical protein L1887_58454 [Cichorium endivia]